jgi:hypothetical protein
MLSALVLALAPAPSTIIFQDDFDSAPVAPPYFEVTGGDSFVHDPTGGIGGGGAMKCTFQKGQVSAGGLKVLFGRSYFQGRAIDPERDFREIYWRVYVKHEKGWEGNPDKLARTTTLANNWAQGHIGHVWSMGNVLGLDPATGVQDSRLVTTKYNDFANLKWLGIRKGSYPIFSTEESGKWVCVEAHVKLNTPGKGDGVFELWINGKMEASHTDLDWHGSWQKLAINAFFLENYWNKGSVKTQSRWFDKLAIGTTRIGPAK